MAACVWAASLVGSAACERASVVKPMPSAGAPNDGGGGESSRESFLETDQLGILPARLSDIGLYLSPNERSRLHRRAQLYEPAHPLFSNGLDKERLLVLPEGAQIELDEGQFVFPAGTLFFKTFFATEREGAEARPIETRVIRQAGKAFEFYAYLWETDGGDARLLDGNRPTRVPVVVDEEAFEHSVPSRLDCRTCHENNEQAVLGFTPLQLAESLVSGERSQLEELWTLGTLGAIPEQPRRLARGDDLRARILSYFEGNCTHCHDGGSGLNSAFDLRFEVAERNVIEVQTSSELWGGLRVAPGAPLESAIYLALSRDPALGSGSPMPPLGVQRRDELAMELFEKYIISLNNGEQ